MVKTTDYRLKHKIKTTYADITINTNHLAIITYLQKAYDIVVNKIKEYEQMRKLKLDFFKKEKKEVEK